MKNRYALTNGLITGTDNSYTAAVWYETDDNLQCLHESGEPLYKIDKGKHKLRTQAELESGDKYKAWANVPIKSKLVEIDAASIRSIREYLSGKADAPKELKDHETEAISERSKLK